MKAQGDNTIAGLRGRLEPTGFYAPLEPSPPGVSLCGDRWVCAGCAPLRPVETLAGAGRSYRKAPSRRVLAGGSFGARRLDPNWPGLPAVAAGPLAGCAWTTFLSRSGT